MGRWTSNQFPSTGTVHVEGRSYAIDTACQMHRPPATATSPPSCASHLYSRSYTLPERWPFPPIHLVMESQPGTCDMYKSSQACCAAASRFSDVFIEARVREVIASFLTGCQRRTTSRPCLSLDLGANNGWMSAYMLSLGSHVVAVEPAPDLAMAVNDTGALNCWTARLVVVNAFACSPVPARMRWCPGPKGVPATNGHRLGGTPVRLAQRQPRIHGMQLKEILALRPPSWPGPRIDRHFDLIKMDGDGPEGIWLEYLAQQVSKGSISIDTLTLEANGIRSSSMRRFQHEFGYTVLRLDFAAADPRRFITSKGWDAYSPRGTFAPLSRFGAHERDDLEEEVFSVRAMRRVFLIKPNLTEAQWKVVLTPSKQKRPGSVLQFVITRQSGLLNPVLGGQYRRSDAWIASRYVPPEHGLD